MVNQNNKAGKVSGLFEGSWAAICASPHIAVQTALTIYSYPAYSLEFEGLQHHVVLEPMLLSLGEDRM